MMEAWAIVDAVNRLRALVAATRGLKRGPAVVSFNRSVEGVETLRNAVQHLIGEVEELERTSSSGRNPSLLSRFERELPPMMTRAVACPPREAGWLMVVASHRASRRCLVRRSDDGEAGGTVASRPAGGEEEEAAREPDYRFTLANERTLLAWIRTALALDAAGLAVIRYAPELAVHGAREGVGIVLVLIGAITAWASYRRFVRIDQAMRAGRPLPVTSLPRLLSMSMFVLSLAVVVLLLADRVGA